MHTDRLFSSTLTDDFLFAEIRQVGDTEDSPGRQTSGSKSQREAIQILIVRSLHTEVGCLQSHPEGGTAVHFLAPSTEDVFARWHWQAAVDDAHAGCSDR